MGLPARDSIRSWCHLGGPRSFLSFLLPFTRFCHTSTFRPRTHLLFLLKTKLRFTYTMGRIEKPKALIVGAGIGGVATAARLARDFDVTILEKNDFTGGRCSLIQKEGYVSRITTRFVYPSY